jgi:hypothetical protein
LALKGLSASINGIKWVAVALLAMFLLSVNQVFAQKSDKSYLKKKSKRVGGFKGGSLHFDKDKRYISAGISVDFLNYFGDLAPQSNVGSTKISLTRPGFSIYGTYRYTANLSFRASFAYGRMVGDDYEADPYGTESRFRYVRNLSFRNDIKELAAIATWDIFGNYNDFLNRQTFTPYVYTGIAVFHHNPKAKAPALDKLGNPLENAGEWVALRPLGTEGQLSEFYDVKQYSTIQASIPFGAGVRAKINERLDFEFEIGYRYLFTDYIDDVSGMYVDLGALDSELARAMSDRATEPTGGIKGGERDFEAINAITVPKTYTSEYNGQTYRIFAGYGQEAAENNRGSSSGNDIYIVTSFKVSYILSGSFRKAKFR